ncbi:hypothetical protein CWC15_01545 [Pseudoalteromonas spongiae]|nr:hypothetical protein CWC15_01545 [Pseudoalteromonas spongiae]
MPRLIKLNSHRISIALAFVVIAALFCTIIAKQFTSGDTQFSSDILAVVPQSDVIASPAITQAKAIIQQRSSGQLVFSSGNKHALLAFKQRLEQNAALTYIPPPDIKLDKVVAFYSRYPGSLMSSSYPSQLSEPSELLNYTLAELTKPDSTLSASSLSSDPTLALASFLNGVSHTGSMGQQDGLFKVQLSRAQQQVFAADDAHKTFYLARFMLTENGADFSQNIALTQQITGLISQFEAEYNSRIYFSGFAFHGSENAQQAEYEISTFGIISLVAVVLLVLVFFRNLIVIGLMLVTILNACIWGMAALVLVFDNIELIGLVFSVTLIGVAIDYLFHVLCAEKNTITTSLVLGFVTTAAGYALYSFSPMALLQQVAVFMIFGLLGALVFSLFCQYALDLKLKKPRIAWANVLMLLNREKEKLLAVLVVLFSLGFLVKPIVHQDDVAVLSNTSETLKHNEMFNLALLGQSNKHHFLLTADSMQSALEKQETVVKWLEKNANQVEVNSLANYLPSLNAQQTTYTLLQNKVVAGHYTEVSNSLGINVGVEQYSPLTVSEFKQSPLKQLLPLHLVFEDAHNAVLWFNVDTLTSDTLNELLNEHGDFLHLLDKRQEISDALGHYRSTVMGLMALSAVVAMLVMALRFDLVTALLSGLIIGLVTLCALLLSSWIQGAVNLFNYLATILILALAIDYLIFYRSKGLCQSNLQAISLSLCSSCLVFGILILSKTPAVFSFGLTLVIGLVSLYLLAPCIVKERK